MAYLSLTDLKLYLGISGTAEDTLLTALLAAAQAAVDAYCDRTFEADADSTRVFEAGRDTNGDLLYLDHDLCQVTSITNGDPAATVLAASAYRLEPADPPYLVVRLQDDTLVAWEGEISIVGRWAYSLNAPEVIVQATREYTAYLYRAYDQQGNPQRRSDDGLPRHIQQILAGFRRLR